MTPQQTDSTDEMVVALGPSLDEVVLLERALRSLVDAESALSELRVFHHQQDVPLREVQTAVSVQLRLISRLT